MEELRIKPIGRVANDERDVGRVDWSAVRSELRLRPEFEPALLGLGDYSHVIVVGWLERLPEDLRRRLRAYPGGDERLPLQGALALRGARPNPLSVTVCELLAVDGAKLRVRGLDLVDETPLLDVKPYIAHYDAVSDASIPTWARG